MQKVLVANMLRFVLCFSFCFCLVWTSPVQNRLPSKIPVRHVGGRIINGEKAVLGQFPWQAGLFLGNETEWFCGGTIISELWVLTAARCLYGTGIAYVYEGGLDFTSAPEVALSTEFILHENFSVDSLENDIGLIKLRKPLLFDENTAAVALASEPLEAGVEATVAGWGATSDNYTDEELGYLADTLYYAPVTSIDNSECAETYGSAIVDSMVCTTYSGDSVEGICIGDSGDPLVVNADSDPVVVAIGSFLSGNGCEAGDPSGFTRIDLYRDWIKTNTGV